MPSETIDLLIDARWVLPIAPVNTALAQHTVAVTDGRVVAVGPTAQMAARFQAREHVSRPNHALLPGFVNAYTRAATTLLRGAAVEGPRSRWIRETLSPLEQRFASPDLVRDGTRLAIAEMLQAGITCFAATDLFPEEAARVASSARVRAAIGLPVADTPTVWADSANEYFSKAEGLWDAYRADPWVGLYFGLGDSLSVEDSTLSRVRRVADELDARVAMPVHESAEEIRDSVARFGKRPLQRLQSLGLLRPGFTAVHATQIDATDLEALSRTGVCVVTCPQASLRLDGGMSPVALLESHGVAVGLGTDSAACAGALDVLAEARAAALFGGAEAAAALRMATLGGAMALGMGSLVGSIEAGKAADFVCFDLGSLAFQPQVRVADAVLYSATRANACDVWTSGRRAVSDGRLLAFDQQEISALARQWGERLRLEIPL